MGQDLLAPAPPEPAAAIAYAETLLPWEDYGWHPLFTARLGPAKIQQGVYTAFHDLDRDPREEDQRLLGDQETTPAPILDVAEELAAAIDRIRQDRPAFPAATTSTGATLEELRSLGYLAGSAITPPAERVPGLRDPRGQTSFHSRVAGVLAAYRDGRSEAAAMALRALLDEEPGNPFLQDLAGSVAMARGKPAIAADHFAAALAHTPDRGAVEIHLAEALLALEQPQEAEIRARHALISLPDPPPIRAALSLCLAVAGQGRHQEARECAGAFLAARDEESAENPLLARLRALAGHPGNR
jgi:tetratricopeptide (TPR) repeat protein